jgi:hypothetical protein
MNLRGLAPSPFFKETRSYYYNLGSLNPPPARGGHPLFLRGTRFVLLFGMIAFDWRRSNLPHKQMNLSGLAPSPFLLKGVAASGGRGIR